METRIGERGGGEQRLPAVTSRACPLRSRHEPRQQVSVPHLGRSAKNESPPSDHLNSKAPIFSPRMTKHLPIEDHCDDHRYYLSRNIPERSLEPNLENHYEYD